MTVRLQMGAFFVSSQAVRILFTGGQDTFSQVVRIRLFTGGQDPLDKRKLPYYD